MNSMLNQLTGPPGSDSELGKAWKTLQTVVEEKNMSDATVRAKLNEWRRLHEKARAELKDAQANLVTVLTLRQEAVMLMVGVL